MENDEDETDDEAGEKGDREADDSVDDHPLGLFARTLFTKSQDQPDARCDNDDDGREREIVENANDDRNDDFSQRSVREPLDAPGRTQPRHDTAAVEDRRQGDRWHKRYARNDASKQTTKGTVVHVHFPSL